MTAVLTFESLPDSEHTFERTDVELRIQDQVYLVGSLKRSYYGSDTDGGLISGSASECTRDGQKNECAKVAPIEILDKKLCVVPAKSRPRDMKDVYAAIWLAPGYKVMLLPARRNRVFYQRAVPGNRKWREVDEGYSVDLADPLMTVLDNAIHIKIDVRPDKSSSKTDVSGKVSRLLGRLQQLQNYPTQRSSSTKDRSVVPGVHTELEGTETHWSPKPSQITARVTVTWHRGDSVKERMRTEPEKGRIEDLRAKREKLWREMEMDIKDLDRMEPDINPFLDADSGSSRAQKSSGSSTTDLEYESHSVPEDLPPPPPSPGVTPTADENSSSSRPKSERSKSNTTKSPPQSRESSREPGEDKEPKKRTRGRSTSPRSDRRVPPPKSA